MDASVLLAPFRRWEDARRKAMREEAARRKKKAAAVSKRRRRFAKEMSADSQDFWERHRLEREHAYRIPVANRKSVTRERALARAKAEKKGVVGARG